MAWNFVCANFRISSRGDGFFAAGWLTDGLKDDSGTMVVPFFVGGRTTLGTVVVLTSDGTVVVPSNTPICRV